MASDLVCGCGASDVPGVTGCSAECMEPVPPPMTLAEFTAIANRAAEDDRETTEAMSTWRYVAELAVFGDILADRKDGREDRVADNVYNVDAAAIFAARDDRVALLAEVKRLRAHIGLVEAQRDQVWAVKERLASVVEHDVLGLREEVTRLRPMETALAAVRELHQPYGIYDECNHAHTDQDLDDGTAFEVGGDFYSCADGLLYWACTACCTFRYDDGEIIEQSETCANGGHGHGHAKTGPICPTRAALDGGASDA